MQGDGDIFVKHVSKDKCIVVNALMYNPSIRLVDWAGLTSSIEYDNAIDKTAQPIPKQRFNIERQQVILQLING